MYVQGAAIALAQKLMAGSDEQSKQSQPSKLSSVDDCGTSSSGLASEKTSIGKYFVLNTYEKLSCGTSVLFFIKNIFLLQISGEINN